MSQDILKAVSSKWSAIFNSLYTLQYAVMLQVYIDRTSVGLHYNAHLRNMIKPMLKLTGIHAVATRD